MRVDVGPRWTAALFDLDGTLIDTRPGMRAALGAALAEIIGDESGTGRANLSLPLDAMIRSAAPSAPEAVCRKLSVAFRKHYDAGHWKRAEVYPGAEACLRELGAGGVRAFVVTNKRGVAAGRLLEHFHLGGHVESVFGQPETGAPIPKSELGELCVRAAGLDAPATAVVGDSDSDASMAVSLGMTFIALTSGAGPLSHPSADQNRIEVVSLADAATFILNGRKSS